MKVFAVLVAVVAVVATCALAGYNVPAARTRAASLCQQASGGSIDKWCTDFNNQVLQAGGQAPSSRSAAGMNDGLIRRGWRSVAWPGSCADGTVLFWRQGSCPDFAGNNHVAMCFGSRRFQWNPSRCSSGPAWGSCRPNVLTYPGFGGASA
jgi:hypothetical protein